MSNCLHLSDIEVGCPEGKRQALPGFQGHYLGIWIKGKSISGSTHGSKSNWPFGYRELRVLGGGGVSVYLVTIIEWIFENSLSKPLVKTVKNISTFSPWLITLEEKWMLYFLRIICTYSWGSMEHRAQNSSCDRGLNLCSTIFYLCYLKQVV